MGPIRTIIPDISFIHFKVEFEDAGIELTSRLYKSLLLSAVKTLHGDVGIRCEIDVIELVSDGSAIVRVERRAYSELCGALTVVNSHEGEPCHIDIIISSPFALSMPGKAGENWERFML